MKIAVITGASSGMGQESAIGLWEQFSGLDEIWAVGRSKYSGAQICSGSESGKRTGDLKS